jgi:hypothetical protein
VNANGRLHLETGVNAGLWFGASTAGIAERAVDNLTFYSQSTAIMEVSGNTLRNVAAAARVNMAVGSASAPAFGFNTAGADNGMYLIGDGDIGFTANGTKFFEIGGAQTALVQNAVAATGDTELVVKEGAGQSSAPLQVVTAADAALFSVNPGGGFGGPGRALGSLGTPADGTAEYCTDCLKGSDPCTAASTGAYAVRVAGAWQCL